LFSDYSYGFRPGRSAHPAIETARAHVAAGHRWCVELDLEKFFDRVNHDVLMAYTERQIEDKRVLRLIRRYLEAGMLSPLLSNILLNELDHEWNLGAPHMNQALPKKLWDGLGLVSVLDTINRLSRVT
jgi:RNA-directed DNA polymerase